VWMGLGSWIGLGVWMGLGGWIGLGVRRGLGGWTELGVRVGLRVGGHGRVGGAGSPVRSGQKGAECGLDRGRGGRVGHGHRRHPELGRLPGQELRVAAARGQGHHPEPARIAPDDVERLRADRAGRTEDYDLAGLCWLLLVRGDPFSVRGGSPPRRTPLGGRRACWPCRLRRRARALPGLGSRGGHLGFHRSIVRYRESRRGRRPDIAVGQAGRVVRRLDMTAGRRDATERAGCTAAAP
jgi:hypothetical protein